MKARTSAVVTLSAGLDAKAKNALRSDAVATRVLWRARDSTNSK